MKNDVLPLGDSSSFFNLNLIKYFSLHLPIVLKNINLRIKYMFSNCIAYKNKYLND